MDHFNLLLDAGAEIRVPDGVSSRGWNLLAFCIAGKGLSSSLSPHTPTHSHPENTASAIDMVKSLVKHPRVGIKVVREMLSECMGHSKITPLMLAASLENVAMVELLKEMLLEGVYIQQSSEGRTVLHIASNTGKPDLVHSLLTAEHLSPSPQEDSKLVGPFLMVLSLFLNNVYILTILHLPSDCNKSRDSGCNCTRRSCWIHSYRHRYGICMQHQTKKTKDQ